MPFEGFYKTLACEGGDVTRARPASETVEFLLISRRSKKQTQDPPKDILTEARKTYFANFVFWHSRAYFGSPGPPGLYAMVRKIRRFQLSYFWQDWGHSDRTM